MPRPLPFLLLASLLLAGCVQLSSAVEQELDAAASAFSPLAFTDMRIIDGMRAGGEPVIAITPTGTILVSAHPGWTHTRYPPSPNLVLPASGQSYLWRSTDGGETWQHVGLPMAPMGIGPRGVGQGVSDPDFAIDSNGRIYLTDLEALAAASVSWSDDDGATWILGNNLASTYGPIDRQWLATHGTDVYLVGNYFLDQRVLRSTDGGLTWRQVGSANCGGDMVANKDGALLVGCQTGIDVSEDGGATFEQRDVPGAESWSRSMAEPAVDAAGNVYIPYTNSRGVFVAGSPDLGRTWWPPIQLASNGTNVWPWVVAGDAGRVAVVWYHTDDPAGPSDAGGDWYVDGAIVTRADTELPIVHGVRIAGPIFQGKMCQRGTICQADTSENGDRRLGDFFEAAIDAEGALHVVYSVALGDSIAHPGYSKQLDGPRLRVGSPSS
ncbi:MAG TPA: sialidase family protein [Candidatus Thermoplasmatota archaeon]|nr:sialidase family protein [Candidatus Thermoplasmatota archaeon]